MIKDTILDLEKKFFKLEYMKNPQWLDQVLHDKFIECGKSGCLFNKRDTMEALLAYEADRCIEIYNYEFDNLDKKTYLIHYLTQAEGELFYRTSIWVMEKNLKLLFHQATRLVQSIELNRF